MEGREKPIAQNGRRKGSRQLHGDEPGRIRQADSREGTARGAGQSDGGAPETDLNAKINAMSAAPVAMALPNNASAMFPPARRSATIPDPTMAARSMALPNPSATYSRAGNPFTTVVRITIPGKPFFSNIRILGWPASGYSRLQRRPRFPV